MEGAVHAGDRSVWSHLKGLIGSKVAKSTRDSMTLCPFGSQSHCCQWGEGTRAALSCLLQCLFLCNGLQDRAMSSPNPGLPRKT